jgi:hypothetical protein
MASRSQLNSNWATGAFHARHLPQFYAAQHRPTAFERKAADLGLRTDQEISLSPVMIRWAENHKSTCYIPEWMLTQWGMKVDDTL